MGILKVTKYKNGKKTIQWTGVLFALLVLVVLHLGLYWLDRISGGRGFMPIFFFCLNTFLVSVNIYMELNKP